MVGLILTSVHFNLCYHIAMNILFTIREQDIIPQSTVVDTSSFRKRSAARAVLLDENGEVYLLNVSKHGYHKLPGGGVKEGEELSYALERELMEELGCKAEVLVELITQVLFAINILLEYWSLNPKLVVELPVPILITLFVKTFEHLDLFFVLQLLY